MKLTDIKLHSVKYYIASLKLTAGDKEFDVPRTMVSNIQIKNDYKNFVYPFFYIAMNIPGWMYVAVAKNSENCYITLDLQAALFRTDLEEDKNPTMLPEYKGRYRAFCDIDTPVTDENIQMQIEKADDSHDKNYEFNETYYTEFILYNPAYYDAQEKKLNAVLTSPNMTQIVTYVLQYGGINKMLMSPLDNTQSYSEFKIIPVNPVDEMKNLIHSYGLHNPGTTFFMDLDRAFLTKRTNKCTCWYKGEYKTVHIMALQNYNDGLSKFSGYYQNSKEKYHLIAVPPAGSSSSEDITPPRATGDHTIDFYTTAAIMEAFTPNKLFIVNVDAPGCNQDNKLNGSYYIDSVSVTMTNGGEYLDPNFHFTLTRDK